MGWDNVFHCEWNEFGQKILKHYWPKAISYGDITKMDFRKHRGAIDIITGGFPCQPYSLAGKRKGKEDERHLWPEMLRAIGEIQPCWVVGENVPGIINWSRGMVFHEVQTDLEAKGYEVFPVILPACGVNAPHKRERIWFVAYSTNTGIKGMQQRENGILSDNIITNSHGVGRESGTLVRGKVSEELRRPKSNKRETSSVTSDTEGKRYTIPCSRDKEFSAQAGSGLHGGNGINFGRGGKWQDFPTQSPLCSRDDGISSKLDGITFSKWRNESIKAYGNAIVPQVVFQIFKAIEQFNN